MLGRATVLGLATALMLVSAGCGGDDEPAGTPSPIEVPDPGGSAPGSGAPPADNGAEPTPRAPVSFDQEGQRGTFDCDGQNIAVNAEEVDLHLVGPCGTVVVNGEEARVVVDDAQVIVVNGDDARVFYSGDPEVTVTDDDATAERTG